MSKRTFRISNGTPTPILIFVATDKTGVTVLVNPISEEDLDEDERGGGADNDNDDGFEQAEVMENNAGELFTDTLATGQHSDIVLDDDEITDWPGGAGLLKFVDRQFNDFGYAVTMGETQKKDCVQLVIRVTASA